MHPNVSNQIMPCCVLAAIMALSARAWDVVRTAASMAVGRIATMGSDQPVILYALVAGVAFVTAVIALTWNTKTLQP